MSSMTGPSQPMGGFQIEVCRALQVRFTFFKEKAPKRDLIACFKILHVAKDFIVTSK